jgi:hypothetical protein
LEALVEFIKSKETVDLLVEEAAEEEAKVEQPAAPAPVETVISVPTGGGRVIEVHVRDEMNFSQSTQTTTTPPPSVEVFGGDWIGYAASQRRAEELVRIRQDEERRQRNAANYQVPPSFFAPPEMKTVRITQEQAGSLVGQQGKRWIDAQGVAWALSFSGYAPGAGDEAPAPNVLITLDRRNVANCTEDVSEECGRLLRKLKYSIQRIVPGMRLRGFTTGPHLIEEPEPEPPQGAQPEPPEPEDRKKGPDSPADPQKPT